jgi:hypothetical protein
MTTAIVQMGATNLVGVFAFTLNHLDSETSSENINRYERVRAGHVLLCQQRSHRREDIEYEGERRSMRYVSPLFFFSVSGDSQPSGVAEPECCDGSDEPAGVCPDRCIEVGTAYRAALEAERKLRKTGAKIRSTYIVFAHKEKQRLEAEIVSLTREISSREREVARLKGRPLSFANTFYFV